MSISLFNGLSGLSSYQRMLDVISNNISNVNSHGFKAQSFNMVENKSQTVRQGSSPTEDLGGTNPIQVGYGVKAGSVSADFTQGTLESTNRTLDMAIQGDGFFVLKDSAGSKNFSRVGNFALDSTGYLVDQGTGYRVQSAQGNRWG